MAKAKPKADGAAPKRARKAKAPAEKRGIPLADVARAEKATVAGIEAAVAEAGGTVLVSFRDPLGGHSLVLAALPLEKVAPTPYQRDLSPMHVARLETAMRKIDRYLDPIVAVRAEGGGFWTPNGNHRLNAMRAIGASAITALVVPEAETAFQILALNTEKAHGLREKALEVARMERALATSDRKETEWAFEFEEAAYATLGLCYEENGRFGGGAYQPLLRRCDGFLDLPMAKAVEERARRARRILALDEKVATIVAALKERGLQSAYLRPFVVARLNPLRFVPPNVVKAKPPEFDATLDKMDAAAAKFDVTKIRAEDLAKSGGPPVAEE
jgi:ParB family chromosome partitioning protein